MIFNLETKEAEFIINVLNELPTKSGVYPLSQKLIAQFNSQSEEGQKEEQEKKEEMKPGEPE